MTPALATSSPAKEGVHAKTLGPEWSALLAACSVLPDDERHARLRALAQQPIRCEPLFALADRHGMQPLLCHALSGVVDVLPPDAARALKENQQANLYKAMLLSRELLRILNHFAVLDIPAMPYKGLALAETLYGDLALRQAGDIDLLILPQDFARVREAARELGYTPHTRLPAQHERAYLKSGYECSFDGPAGPNLLEVQWAIQPKFYAIDFDIAAIFERAVTVTVAGQPMRSPSPEDLFLILAAHAAKHVWGRLIWLSDLARLMRLPNLDWNWIASQAKTLGLVRILQISMLLSERMLESAAPPAAALFAADAATSALADEIQTHFLGESPYNVESFAYFRLMLRLRERPTDRWRFLHRLALTPGPGEWNAIRLPAPLTPLYRLVRLSRLAARLLRT